MTPAPAATPSATRQSAGIIADGAFKVLLGAAYVVGVSLLGGLFGVPAWLMVAAGVALVAGGGAEIKCVRSRPSRVYMRLMVAYDCGWLLASLLAFLVARQHGSSGGEVWMGYQTAAPLAFAALLLLATPTPPTSVPRAEGSGR